MSLNKNKSFQNGSHGCMRVTVAHIPGKRGYSGADELKVDPAIIGGLVVKMGSRMVDASLKTKLNSIRLAMKEVG